MRESSRASPLASFASIQGWGHELTRETCKANAVWLVSIFVAAALILYPVVTLAISSFVDAPPGESGAFTLANYTELFGRRGVYGIFLNSMWIAVVSSVIAVVPGVFLAWLVVRTDVPFRKTIEAFAIIPFLIPVSIQSVGWAILGNPDAGLVNQLLGVKLLDIYSYWGVAFVLGQHSVGFIYLMALGPFRNMNPSLEDAARLSGATAWQTFRRVQLPLLVPALVPVTILVFARALESFEAPVILGTPGNVQVITNDIYDRLKIDSPPNYGSAIALACLATAGLALLFAFQSWVGKRKKFITLTGKGFQQRQIKLGAWMIPCIVLVAAFAILTTVLPLGIILFASFFKIFGVYEVAHLTLDNYSHVLQEDVIWRAIGNTLLLMVVCASICIAFGSAIAYAVRRRVSSVRTPVEMLLAVPWALPGLVFGLAMLWAYIPVPGVYGTLFAIGIAYVTFGLSIGFRSIDAQLGQMSPDLEEAARAHGASTLQTLRHIVVPLMKPGLIAGWFVLATIFSRELAASILLYSHGSEVLSVELLGYWEQGRANYAAVTSVIMLVLLSLLFAAERIVSRPNMVKAQ